MDDTYLWWKDGVIYQIYPRSFMDSNEDGIGDLPGISSKLDYLVNLGIDAIWLSPFFPSPDVDFGYDITDYLGVDAKFGTFSDLEFLITEAHSRGIRIILDLVLNHTSDQHPWFIQSRRSHDNPYRNWYIWRSTDKGQLPNNWISVFGGTGWELSQDTGDYYYHMFYKEQPDLNWRNPQVRQAMFDVMRFWLEKGVDGFRLDVFNVYFKHSLFPDNPPKFGLRDFDRQSHLYDFDQPEMILLLKEMRTLLDAYPERYAVGEPLLATTKQAARYCDSGLLHAVFEFSLSRSPWSARRFLSTAQNWSMALSPESWPNYVLNNHDITRSASRYGWGEDDERLKVAAAFLLTQRGTPFLYYGEEIGMRNIPLKRSQIQDLIGKRYWPIFPGRDGCRAPFQWDDTPNAGFSKVRPWLPVHPDYTWRNVAAQSEDPDSLLTFYRRLLRLRREHTALRQGIFLSLTFDPRFVLGYLRQDASETILVALNFSRIPLRLVLGGKLAIRTWQVLLSNRREEGEKFSGSFLPLGKNEVCILKMGKL